MKSNGRLSWGVKFLVLGILVACFLAVRASAEPTPLYQANFTLPFQVLWGGMVLQPGEYSITLDPAGSKSFVTVRGENGAVSLTLRSISRRAFVGQSALVVKRDGRKRMVHAVDLAEVGVVLYFEVHGRQHLARDPERMERVPIRSVPWGACPEYCLG
jgi:hypothetical protein